MPAAQIEQGPVKSSALIVGGKAVPGRGALTLRPDQPCLFDNGAAPAGSEIVHVLVLQGRPIGQPVAQRGPMVMNTQAELAQVSAPAPPLCAPAPPLRSPAPAAGERESATLSITELSRQASTPDIVTTSYLFTSSPSLPIHRSA